MSQTVFVLEDDTDIARLVQHHLEAAGFATRLFVTPANLIPDADDRTADLVGGEPLALRAAVAYVAGMTDRYAMDEHRRLTDISVNG